MDFASVVFTEAVKASPHYAVLGLIAWRLLARLGKAHDSLVEVAQQSATALGQNAECLRELVYEIRGVNGAGPTRQHARPTVTVSGSDESITSS